MPSDKKPTLANEGKRYRVSVVKPLKASRVYRAAKPKNELSKTGWIGAIDTLRLLTPHFGEEQRAKAELILKLRKGDLTCRAVCWCQEADRGKVDLHDIDWGGHKTSRPHQGQKEPTELKEPEEEETHVVVPNDIFLASNGWTIDVDEADWKWGYFIARKPAELLSSSSRDDTSKPLIRRFACGLEFHVSEIGALIPSLLTVDSEALIEDEALSDTEEPPKRGRRVHDGWPPWFKEVVNLHREGKITSKTSANAVIKWIGDRLIKRKIEVPSKSKTHPAAMAVINILKNIEESKLDPPRE